MQLEAGGGPEKGPGEEAEVALRAETMILPGFGNLTGGAGGGARTRPGKGLRLGPPASPDFGLWRGGQDAALDQWIPAEAVLRVFGANGRNFDSLLGFDFWGGARPCCGGSRSGLLDGCQLPPSGRPGLRDLTTIGVRSPDPESLCLRTAEPLTARFKPSFLRPPPYRL